MWSWLCTGAEKTRLNTLLQRDACRYCSPQFGVFHRKYRAASLDIVQMSSREDNRWARALIKPAVPSTECQSVKTRIALQLWVKSESDSGALLNRYGFILVPNQNAYVISATLNSWRTNEK